MAYALCLQGLVGDVSIKMDDVFAINKNIGNISVHCKYIVEHLG